jgi:hypothetical protein
LIKSGEVLTVRTRRPFLRTYVTRSRAGFAVEKTSAIRRKQPAEKVRFSEPIFNIGHGAPDTPHQAASRQRVLNSLPKQLAPVA